MHLGQNQGPATIEQEVGYLEVVDQLGSSLPLQLLTQHVVEKSPEFVRFTFSFEIEIDRKCLKIIEVFDAQALQDPQTSLLML